MAADVQHHGHGPPTARGGSPPGLLTRPS